MKKLILYLVVIIATFGVILYIRNPNLFNEIWLWVLGLFGVITGYVDRLLQSIKSWFKKEEERPNATTTTLIPATQMSGMAQPVMNQTAAYQSTESNVVSNSSFAGSTAFSSNHETIDYPALLTEKEKLIQTLEVKIKSLEEGKEGAIRDSFSGETFYLLRYLDDGETTLGLLFHNNTFLCYTLEDAFRSEVIKGKTRIRARDYKIQFREVRDKFTEKYRNRPFLKGLFGWHLQLQDVSGFEDVTINFGGNHKDTSGNILISDGLTDKARKKVLTNSKETYKALYTIIKEDLEKEIPVRIRVFDEHWFEQEILN